MGEFAGEGLAEANDYGEVLAAEGGEETPVQNTCAYSQIELDPSADAFTFDIESVFDAQFLIEILLPIVSIGLTLISIMIELQQVINLCLDFTDDDDDALANRAHAAKGADGKPLRESDFLFEEPTEDCFFESVIVGLWNLLFDLLDAEKIMFPFFFGHKRRL